MLYDIKELNENDYKKECTRLLIAFENLNYKQENAIHIAKNVTIGYGLDLKTGSNPKLLLEGYLPDDSKKLKIGDEELTFYEIIEKYRANKTGFTDPKIVKGYLQNRVFNFSLTQEQAQKVLERTFDSYKKYVSQYISNSLLRYSQEKASLVSLHYHGRFNNIKNSVRNSIIKNSRFLSWFILRYKTNINTYVGYIARSVDEADIYLSNPNINKISLIFDIFSHLIRKESIGYRKYKYNESIKSYASHNKKDILLKLALWYENDLDFIRFNSANKVNNISKANKSICRQVNSGIDELKKLESWDYDIAMLYLTLQGYKFIEARLHFLDSPKDLQKQYQQAFEVLESICKSNNSRDKNKNKEITEKLQPHLEHSHIKAYIEYYHFLYIQRKFELAAQEKNLKKFKKHLYKAQNLIDQLLIDNTQHIYLFTKMKKHKANIMNLIWHIELKEIGRQLEDPFNIELKDNAENKGAYDILSKSNKLYKHIESMLKTNTNPYLKNPKNT